VWLASKKADGLRQTEIGSGGINQSRFGLKGSEDLGGGLKAKFLLESGFKIDTGASSGFTNVAGTTTDANLFSRQAYVGFAGGFGEARLGKMWTAYDDISGMTHPGFDSALSPQNNVWKSTGYNGNPGNSVYYATPGLGGFSGAASYSLGENKTAAVNAGKIASVHAKYEGGPVYAGVAYQTEKATGADDTKKFTRVNASYDLGVAKLLAGYGRVALADQRTTDWQAGADFPVTSALTLSGGYARSRDNAAAGDAKRTGLGLAVSYALSVRTSLYGGVQASKGTKSGTPDVKTDIYAVGIRHTF
jgi:predicted porin